MRQKRFKMAILALSLACVLSIVLAIPACARQEPADTTGSTEMLPVAFTLDSMLDIHEQDIKDKMFEYKFEAASDDPSEQVRLIKQRSDELKNDTASKKGFLMALMKRNGSVSGNQFAAITDEISASLEKLTDMTKKLHDHATDLGILDGDYDYTDSLIDDVNSTKKLASEASRAAKDKENNGNSGNNDNSGKKK